MASSVEVTVCVLLYGDYPRLAAQCLAPLLQLVEAELIDLRIGLNEVSEETEQVLRDSGAWESIMCRSLSNLKKYPMMRRLFAWDTTPIKTPFTMWFDDDSYIQDGVKLHEWLGVVRQHMTANEMIGHIHTIGLSKNQIKWVKRQPWYTGRSGAVIEDARHRVRFATGGWWTARTDFLRRFDWPLKELLHRGGDVMLGELCRQQNLRLGDFHDGVDVNTLPKRGFDSPPIGW